VPITYESRLESRGLHGSVPSELHSTYIRYVRTQYHCTVPGTQVFVFVFKSLDKSPVHLYQVAGLDVNPNILYVSPVAKRTRSVWYAVRRAPYAVRRAPCAIGIALIDAVIRGRVRLVAESRVNMIAREFSRVFWESKNPRP
jgi:hypothetical protein